LLCVNSESTFNLSRLGRVRAGGESRHGSRNFRVCAARFPARASHAEIVSSQNTAAMKSGSAPPKCNGQKVVEETGEMEFLHFCAKAVLIRDVQPKPRDTRV